MKKYLLITLAGICLNWSAAAVSADFVAVRIEAEDFTSKSDRWALTTPTQTPNLGPDPDPPHTSNASGNAYLELLSDTRVTHDDDVLNGGMDGNFWGGPGGGPRIDYDIYVPEAGRYLVWVKTYSTNTEDNGIHVGINGTLPDSGKRIQICSKHNWFWTSGQRTDANHCGVAKSIWLDVPAAGVNRVTFFAREDGFEIDQFMLVKETHDGSKDCFPNFADKIRCRDANTGATLSDSNVPFSESVTDNTVIPTPPEPEPEPQVADVDLDIDVDVAGNTHYVDDNIEYELQVTNNDNNDTATDVVAIVNLPAGLDYVASADCTDANTQVSCVFGDLNPGASQTLSFTARAVTEGSHRIDSLVISDQDDTNSQNNTESETISASYSIPDFEAGITMHQARNAVAAGGDNSYTVAITNNGTQTITNAAINITAGDGIALGACAPSCSVPSTPPGETSSVSFTTIASQSGTVTAELVLNSDANASNNTATSFENVVTSTTAAPANGQIVIEAEAFSSNAAAATDNAPAWYLINEQYTPLDSTLDPDQASPADVSGAAYVEILPDYRVDGNAAELQGTSNFSTGGTGATLTYNVLFSEAGAYTVFARLRANNTQDATLHVGLDNNWSGNPLAVCNPDGSWQWTTSVNANGTCQTTTATILTVATPGIHQVMVSQEADGLELDKLLLEIAPASSPAGTGPTATTLDASTTADLSVSTGFSTESASINEAVNFAVSVSNLGSVDSLGIIVSVEGVQPEDITATSFDSCVESPTGLSCTLATLAAGSTVSETFTVVPGAPINATATVSAAVPDVDTDNNTASAQLQLVDSAIPEESSGGGSTTLWMLAILMLFTGIFGISSTQRQVIRRDISHKDRANNSYTKSQG